MLPRFCLTLLLLSLPAQAADAKKERDVYDHDGQNAAKGVRKIVFVADTAPHGPRGNHEFVAGAIYLARTINAVYPNAHAVVYTKDKWPKDLEHADSVIVLLNHGASAVNPAVKAAAKRGAGFMAIHFGVEVEKGEQGKHYLDWLGGYFETFWSVNPWWTPEFKDFPKHEVTRGVKPFAINDEWYYHMRFVEGMKGVTPILHAVPPLKTVQGDGKASARGGNPAVWQAVKEGKSQVMAWAYDRPDGARGFGFTGLHKHANLGEDHFRTVLLNAVAWVSKLEVPDKGVPSKTLSRDDLEKLIDEAKLIGKRVEAPAPQLIRSAQSGPWSKPTTWEGGKVPGAGAKVQVREGHSVTYDAHSDQAIRLLHIAGTVSFAQDRDTRLDVGLIRIEAGDNASEDGFDCDAHISDPETGKARPALEVGTAERPINKGQRALIRLVYFPGADKQSLPAIVCCAGRMDFHGAPLSRSWVKLGATAKKGATSVTLAEPVTGWKRGDRVVLTATSYQTYKDTQATEERTIQAIDGTTLTLDKPLEVDHLGDGHYRGEVANLSRNVIVESADPKGERGHTMYHRGSAGSISYAEFRHLGKEGVLGRYSLHYHLVGDTMRGSSVVGASIWDSGNRWLTIHGTNYLVVRDVVGYKSVGHGFFLEDGTEVYNVLDRNLAIGARHGKRLPKQVLGFDANNGAGYWWANSLNTFTRNVAVDNGEYGFRYEATASRSQPLELNIQQPDGSKKRIDIRTLPFVRFDDNESHSNSGHYAVNLGEGVNRVGPDTKHPFIVRNLLIWNSHYGLRPQVPSLLVENLRLHGTVYGIYHPNYDNHEYRNVSINGDGSEPFNRGHDDVSAQYGVVTVDGLTFENTRGSRSSIPLIQMSDDNPTGRAESHFRNVKVLRQNPKDPRPVVNLGGGSRVTPKTPQGVPVYLHDYFGQGRHAKVEALNAKDFKADGLTYRAEEPLTGNEARVAEVKDVAFPKLLDPVDDLPPTTVVTEVRRDASGRVTVRGVTADNGTVKRVLVNGKEARAVGSNFSAWEIVLEETGKGALKVTAHSEDAAGNVEKRPHSVVVN